MLDMFLWDIFGIILESLKGLCKMLRGSLSGTELRDDDGLRLALFMLNCLGRTGLYVSGTEIVIV
jgi:hypothetical protein